MKHIKLTNDNDDIMNVVILNEVDLHRLTHGEAIMLEKTGIVIAFAGDKDIQEIMKRFTGERIDIDEDIH